ncbi:hypothetical protein HH212_08080 [Massilia forsythiae]|uniref:Uncharacterized protein n=1 Tax=Massilia forsythiae TaxID=2728020 RepID=A0A7Z2VV21_9BURK|nr:hypothetical protein [Massilia forsythiae]QJD99985.1 hypothetical protein HH212_08080 [Massilia forsythiae]
MAELWINGNLSTTSTVYALLQALENACIGPAPIRDKKNGQAKVVVFTHPILWICRRLSTAAAAKTWMHAGFSVLDSKSAWRTAHSHRLPMADGASDACERHGSAGMRWITSGRRQAIDPGSQAGAMNASHDNGVAGKSAWLCLPDGRATMGESLASCFSVDEPALACSRRCHGAVLQYFRLARLAARCLY